MKKPISYGNFVAPTPYLYNSIAGSSFYPSNHSYNPANYQMHASWASIAGLQGFYPTLKQSNVT